MALLDIFGGAVVLLPLYLVLVTVYRLTFHPLAKYPGPFWRKISGWPDWFGAKTGKRHYLHYQLHCQYGSIVRVGPNRLSFNTADAFHDIHSNKNANVDKTGLVGWNRAINDVHMLQQIRDKYEHAQRRKIVAHAFTDGSLQSTEEFMLKQIRNWTSALIKGANTSTDGWSETKNMAYWSNLLTIDVFGELCFGEDFGATNSGESKIIPILMEGLTLGHLMAYSPIQSLFIPIFRTQTLLKIISKKAYAARWAFREHLQGLIKRRQEAEILSEKGLTAVRKDFFHYVLKGRDDNGNMLPLKQYVSEAVLLVGAGTDTTATTIAAVLYYLATNPDKLKTLRAEVDAAFSTVEDIHSGPTLSSLSYLRACVDEALRIAPPVPGALTRITLPGGHTINGTYIPASIELEVPIYTLHHNEAYYPDPHAFVPERWIPGSKTPTFEVTDELVSRQRHAFVPFSTGARNCLGMRLAYMEARIVLARLTWLFDWRFDVQKQQTMTGEFKTEDYFVCKKEGPWLQFRHREGRGEA